MYPTVNGAYDIPATTDYHYYDVMKLWDSTISIPEQVVYRVINSYDQSKKNNPDTTYACTRYGTTHSINENNAIEWSGIVADPVDEWIIALQEYGAIVDKGDSLRSALLQAKDLQLIEWYAICSDSYQMKYAIASGQCLFTGTMRCDWKQTQKTWVFTEWDWYGHAFAIIGYLPEWLLALNSYWDKYNYKWFTGCFLIKWEDLDLLYTVYALIDKSNAEEIKQEKIKQDNLSKQRMQDKWIRNWQRENEPVTRWEVAIMLDRLDQSE